MASENLHDVIVIGAGLGGSTLAAILARRGLRVLLLEAGTHPRFAVGESVVPEFSLRAKLLAARFDVPELAWLSNFQLVRHKVSANSGVKRNFTYLHHREGAEHRAQDTSQFQAMTYPLGPDCHLYRPDVDAWLTALAVQYGADYRERTPVESVVLDAGGAVVRAGGRELCARFVVDGTGHRSLVARAAGVRAEASLRTNSRSIFTHMVGVAPLAAARRGAGRLPVPSPPDQGTLHHYFDGGWFWVIPFGNHEAAVNPVCSVGLTLDAVRHPDRGTAAADEFAEFVARFPTVARQFQGARAVRSWVKTERLQYQADCLGGARWCLLPHAANFVDPLFSGGMAMTFSGVYEIATVLLAAFAADRFEADAFARLTRTTRDSLAMLDRLVRGSYAAFRSPELFNAWYRIWAVGNFTGSTGLVRLYYKWKSTRDPAFLDRVREDPYRVQLGGALPQMRALLDAGEAILERCEVGEATAEAAAGELYRLLGTQDWIPPQFHAGDPERRRLASFTIFPLLSIIAWGKRRAPADVRAAYYDVGPVFFADLLRSMGVEFGRAAGAAWRMFRDVHVAGGRS